MIVAVSWEGAPPDFVEPLQAYSVLMMSQPEIVALPLRQSVRELVGTFNPTSPTARAHDLTK